MLLFFYLSTYEFGGIHVFVFWISSSIVVKYFIFKSFGDHIHENESSYAKKKKVYFDVRIEAEIHTLERQQNLN